MFDFIQNNKKIIISVFGLIVFIYILFYISTHGNISINRSELQSVTYQKINDSGSTKNIDSNSVQLSSGSYFIRSVLKNGIVSTKQITVPRFLKTKVVNLNKNNKQAKTLALHSGSFAGPVDSNGVDTFNYSGDDSYSDFKTEKNINKNFNVPPFANFVYLSESLLAGYVQADTTVTPVTYNFTTNEANYLTPIELSKPTDPVAVHGITNSTFSLFTNNNGLAIFNSSSPDKQKILKFNGYDISSYDNTALIDTSKKSIAFIEGEPQIISPDGDEVSDTSNVFTLISADFSGNIANSYVIKKNQIKSLYISPGSVYTAIQSNRAIDIYNESGTIMYSFPETISDFKWVDDNSFIFTTNDKNHLLYYGNINGSTQSVYPKDTVNASYISYISVEKNVIFSAFPINNGVNNKPNIYSISLDKESKESSLSSFPYQGNGYYISELNSRVTLQLSRYISDDGYLYDAQGEKKAFEYLSSVNVDKKLVVKKYIDIDVR